MVTTVPGVPEYVESVRPGTILKGMLAKTVEPV
jgi:hypothetical protein